MQKRCSNARCSCRKASLQCSELCRYKECTNKSQDLPCSSSDSDDSSDDEGKKGAQVEFSDNEKEYSECSDIDESANEPEVISEWETSIVYMGLTPNFISCLVFFYRVNFLRVIFLGLFF